MPVWPGHINGRIPLSEMVDVIGDGHESSYLNPAAAYWWRQMVAACLAETGVQLGTEEAYRTYETQAWYAGPNSPLGADVARASPGTSNHGWGLANDITGYNAAWGWLQANAARFGWDWTTGRNSGERWHWEYIGSLDTSGLNLEDDMFEAGDRALAEATNKGVVDAVRRLYGIEQKIDTLLNWVGLNKWALTGNEVPANGLRNITIEGFKKLGVVLADINEDVDDIKATLPKAVAPDLKSMTIEAAELPKE